MITKMKALVAASIAVPMLAVGGWQVAAQAAVHRAASVSAASQFFAVSPTRVLDTRNGVGAPAGAVAANSTTVLDLSTLVPADATAVAVNVTVASPKAGGYLEVYADGTTRPATSTLNFSASQTIANSSIVQLVDDKLDFYNASAGTVQLVVDVTGYFEPSAVTPPPSPSASASASPSTSPSPSASPSTSPSASASPSASPSGTPTGGATTYVQPNTVGYCAGGKCGTQVTDFSALTYYTFPGSGLPGAGVAPAGCSWLAYGLRCDNDDYTWDHVYVDGGVYWTGLGKFTITNSVVLGNTRGSTTVWYDFLGHPASATTTLNANAGIDVEHSTLGWDKLSTEPPGQDVAPAWSLYGNQPLTLLSDDLSGMPQGADPGANSVVQNNYIHDLNQNGGCSGGPCHLDGVYSQGGGNIQIDGNYINPPCEASSTGQPCTRSDVTASLFIQDRGNTDTGIEASGNYFGGGSYVLWNQTGIGMNITNNTWGSPGVNGEVGPDASAGYPGTYGTWSGNVDWSGNAIPHP